MIPSDPKREVIDPRRLVREHGRDALAELVARESGYIFQARPLKDLCQSLKSGMPLLAEGERGGGKTEMVDALAYTCNRPYFELQGMEGLSLKDILFEWDEQAQNKFVVQAVETGALTLDEARRQQWRSEFLNLGEILKAYDFLATTGVAPVVKLDEFEKLPQVCQAFFYQLFTDGHASIPRLEENNGQIGVAKFDEKPIVVLTSNNQHVVHPPLRSRCVYTKVRLPTDFEEAEILRSRVPQASPDLLTQIVKLVRYIRLMMPTVRDKPGLRESIAFLRSLITEGIETLSASVIDDHLGFIARNADDLANLELGLLRLERAAHTGDSVIEEMIRRIFIEPVIRLQEAA
ncbi:MAG TPA: AAA family ATPase [Pyrinomonadaceae bacterium]|jgi:MoxR-like ATPase|nr:AAA family ATPase [Pyrinomonadaceae bacterium]